MKISGIFDAMIQFPNCKINLGLNVVARRSDGFHNIESVFYPVPMNDALEIIPAADGVFQFHATGLTIPCEIEKNLCVRAFRLLESDFRLPAVKIHLHKAIPMGSGLGGGSADGAFTLKMLNELFSLGLSNEKLKSYAGLLGSDCAFFIGNHQPQYATGKGEMLEEIAIDLSGTYLSVVIPDVHVVTSDAYRLVSPQIPKNNLKEVIKLPVEDWKDLLVNDFEKPVIAKFPVIGGIKTKLYESGAIYASMSGSGSAVFGLFRGLPDSTSFESCFHRTVKL